MRRWPCASMGSAFRMRPSCRALPPHNPARIEVLQRRPLIILDGMHNSDGARALAAVLRAEHVQGLTAVMGVLRGKNETEMLRAPFAVPCAHLCRAAAVAARPWRGRTGRGGRARVSRCLCLARCAAGRAACAAKQPQRRAHLRKPVSGGPGAPDVLSLTPAANSDKKYEAYSL